jgi:ferric-dicitrate binding protein FerR (iron transport regulator)
MNQEEFHQALSRLADRDISPELFQKLEEYLLESEEARNDYREFMHLQSLIGLEINVHHGQQKVVPIERIISRQKRRALKVALLSAAAVFLIGMVTMRLFFVAEKVRTFFYQLQYNLTFFALKQPTKIEVK